MRIEIRGEREKNKEIVAEVWLEYTMAGNIALMSRIEGGICNPVVSFHVNSKELFLYYDQIAELGYIISED